MNSKITVRDIAKECGVHFTTAALALRNSPKIAEETRSRIRAVADRLGYRPNPLVSVLMAQRRSQRPPENATVLAYVSFKRPDQAAAKTWHEAALLASARRRAAELGYGFEEFCLYEPGMTAGRLSKILYTRSIPGLLLGPSLLSHSHLPKPLHQFASVAFAHSLLKPSLLRVTHNHSQGSYLACRQLRRKGYRRIGLVLTTLMDRQVNELWSAGYLTFHRHLTASQRPKPLYFSKNDIQSKRLLQWIRTERPDVILTMHTEVREWLEVNGNHLDHCPGLCTLDHGPPWKGYAGIDQNIESIAVAAIDFLVGQIQRNEHGLPQKALTIMLDGNWVDS